MSERSGAVNYELALIGQGVRDRIARARRIVARATAWPFAVRVGVFAAAFAAQALAYPVGVFTGSSVLLVLALAALPALWPRAAAVSAYLVFAVIGWVAATTLYGSVATLPRLVGFAVTLYGVHSGAALAAVLPYDAVVDPVVLARWMLRATGVAAVAVGLSVAAMFLVGGSAQRSYLLATMVGLGVTVALAWLMARAISRRS